MDAERINLSDADPGDVLITLTHPRGGGDRRVTLRIEDQRSGVRLIEVDLTAEQFADVLSSSATVVGGAHLGPDLHRVGKRMANTSIEVRTHGREQDAEVADAVDQLRTEGWEEIRIDRTNFGRRVRAYRWED